ncbi:MAG: hypothetical protein ACOY7U_02670 [Acidobacteriota bacterium]|uniref:Outer membrane protein beta-barrel domain-containing protein n=1 Tax=Thermoanaerobaculum aquaticum TaxID=1312852 RepID=A0A062XU89_9BACT|nr:hypothetical protein [Thermoanaerobaculum aquaticum]KDA54378.1 hypothetical protein EG19_11730 [Thermoanaerobaculum aquaticum]
MKLRVALPLFFAWLSVPLAAQTLLEFTGARPSLDAQARVVDQGVGTEVDFAKDLGMSDEPLPSLRLSHLGKRGFISVAYEKASYTGDRVVERTIEYGGKTYTVGTRVKSDLAVERGVVQLAWQFLASPSGHVAFGPMLELVGLRFEGTLDAPESTPPITESGTFQTALPAPGLALDLRPGKRLRFFARGATLHVSQGSYDSLEAGVLLGPYGPVALGGGFRSLRVNYRDDPDWARLRLSGPYVSLALSF